MDSRIYNLAMKLSRSGATPGLVPANGRWKFEPGGAKQDFGGWDPAKSSLRAIKIRRAMAAERCRAGRGDVVDG